MPQAKQAPTEPKPVERKDYTVKVDGHVHNGERVKKGDKIALTSAQYDVLHALDPAVV